MKTICLCICYSVHNYGSMLQSFATMKYVEMAGLGYKIIKYEKKHNLAFYVKSVLKLAGSNARAIMMRNLKFKKSLQKYPHFAEQLTKRDNAFDVFIKSNFADSVVVCHGYSELQAIGRAYPAYLVGSDQLWLPAGLSTNFYNLNFTDENAIRISYATSFGVSTIPLYQKGRTAKFLKRIQFLSVREQKGVEIVKHITDRNAELVADPTLLITTEDWNRYIPKTDNKYGEYIFVYFIGNNPLHRDAVKELSHKTGLKTIALIHIDEYIQSDENIYDETPFDVSPAEFVNLIRNAKYVCTDSFHGSVFSIISQKQFIVFNRFESGSKNSTNSRIDSLCSVLGLEKRRYDRNIDILNQISAPIDYKTVNEKAEELRKKSIAFLQSAFSSIKEQK